MTVNDTHQLAGNTLVLRRSLAGGLLTLLLLSACNQEVQPGVTPCDDPWGVGCSLSSGTLVRLQSDDPRPLGNIDVEVHGATVSQAWVQLRMLGMDMPPNRFALTRTDTGILRASVVLPYCSAARSDWLLVLDLDNSKHAIAFEIAGR